MTQPKKTASTRVYWAGDQYMVELTVPKDIGEVVVEIPFDVWRELFATEMAIEMATSSPELEGHDKEYSSGSF